MMPTCFNVSVYQIDLQPLVAELWFQFSHKMNDEKMDIDTSVGGNGSGESSISISILVFLIHPTKMFLLMTMF